MLLVKHFKFLGGWQYVDVAGLNFLKQGLKIALRASGYETTYFYLLPLTIII